MPRTVLIVKLAAIGDVVMALPMVTALRDQDPDVRITWMCGHKAAPLVRLVEGISEVVSVNEAAMLAGSPIAQVAAVIGAWRRIGIRRFDAVLIAHSDTRYRVLAWSVVAKLRRWLGGSAGSRGIVPGRLHTDEYLRLVTGLDDYRARSYGPPRIRVELSADLRRRLQRFNPDGCPLVAITPGGARNVARENPLRRWPLDRYAHLARTLQGQGYRVVLTGDRTDGWVRTAFRDINVLDLIGATDLPSLAALLGACAAVVGHDSGPLHLARLLGTHVIALLGPTPPSMFFRPDAKTTVLWPGGLLPCAPCYNGHEFASCRNNVCMHMIDCDDVARCVQTPLSRPETFAS